MLTKIGIIGVETCRASIAFQSILRKKRCPLMRAISSSPHPKRTSGFFLNS